MTTLRSAALAVTVFCGFSAVIGVSCASAQVVDDPLHGYCAGAGQCIDNGINSPTSTNPPSNFGFDVSPGPASGDFVVDILVPNNETKPASFGIIGTLSGTATLFSATAWTSGDLNAFLGILASPANPIGAFIPDPSDPSATGFFVYQVNFGTTTLQDASDPDVSPLENISSGALAQGSYIVGFLNEGTAGSPNWIATANSGAILETSPPGVLRSAVPEPSTWAMMLLGFAGLGFAAYRKRRRPAISIV